MVELKASPGTKAAGNDFGVDLNKSCPQSQSASQESR